MPISCVRPLCFCRSVQLSGAWTLPTAENLHDCSFFHHCGVITSSTALSDVTLDDLEMCHTMWASAAAHYMFICAIGESSISIMSLNNNEIMFAQKQNSTKQKQKAFLKCANLSTLLSLGISNIFTASYSTVAYLFWPQTGRGPVHFNGKPEQKWRVICQ